MRGQYSCARRPINRAWKSRPLELFTGPSKKLAGRWGEMRFFFFLPQFSWSFTKNGRYAVTSHQEAAMGEPQPYLAHFGGVERDLSPRRGRDTSAQGNALGRKTTKSRRPERAQHPHRVGRVCQRVKERPGTPASPSPLSQWGRFPIFTGVRISHRATPTKVAPLRGITRRASPRASRYVQNSSKVSKPNLRRKNPPRSFRLSL